MISLLIVAAILVPIFWMVLTPINIRIDTKRDIYRISQPGTIMLVFNPGDAQPAKLRLFGFWMDLRSKVRPNGPVKRPVAPSRRRTKSLAAWARLIRGMFNCIRCRRFILRVDLNDVMWNAQLFPLTYLATGGPLVLDINFRREYQLEVWLHVRLYRMFVPILRFFLTK